MDSLKSLYEYWFRFGSPVTLGVFRAILCGLSTINLFMIGIFLPDFLGEKGYIPAWLASKYINNSVYLTQDGFALQRINLFNGISNDPLTFGIYWAIVVAGIFATLGLFTRVSTVIFAIGLVSIQHRLGLFLHGGDSVMRVMAIYLAVAPSGAAFSLDRYFAVKAGRAPAQPPLISLWPQRLIAYNCAIIYLTTTWAKWFGVLWKSGVATWYPARLHEFDRFPVPAFFNDFPMVKVTTWGTLLVEFALATLVWFKPLRKWVLLCGIGMHSYIEYSMNIPLFAFLMVSMYVCFYEGEEVSGWWDRLKSKFPQTGSAGQHDR